MTAPRKVLLVAAEAARLGVALEGFEVDTAADADEALERLRASPFDLLLLGSAEERRTPLAALRRLHAAHPGLPVIVLDGGGGDEALAALRAGAEDVLAAPPGDAALSRAMAFAIERKRVEDELRQREQRWALALTGANDGVWDWDLESGRAYFSPRFKESLGYDDDEVGDRIEEWFDRVHPADLDQLKRMISSHLAGAAPRVDCEHRVRDSHGRYRWFVTRARALRDADGNAARLAGSLSDIDARKLGEQQLLHDAMHDALTGLANTALLIDRLALALAQGSRGRETGFALLFLDLDHFKAVNDRHGHAVGDQLLVAVALRLQTLVRPGDTVARLGGDEFVILAHGIADPSDASRIAERVHEELADPFELGEVQVRASTSIGIALGASGYDRPEELVHDADTAMYRAKALGPGRFAIFDEQMHRQVTERLELESELRAAVAAGELELRYQPIVRLEDGRLEGLEALVRWRHPRRGLLRPADFLGMAEDTGLIVPLGVEVLRKACGQMATWHRQVAGSGEIGVHVNLSPRQFHHPELMRQVREALETTGFAPRRLKLEIREGAIMADTAAALARLDELLELGVRVHVDGFGAGGASLVCLHRVRAEALKVDRSLVGSGAADLLATAVSVARTLGVAVTVEGLETPEQLDRVRALECESAQGFLLSRPLDAEGARSLMASGARW